MWWIRLFRSASEMLRNSECCENFEGLLIPVRIGRSLARALANVLSTAAAAAAASQFHCSASRECACLSVGRVHTKRTIGTTANPTQLPLDIVLRPQRRRMDLVYRTLANGVSKFESSKLSTKYQPTESRVYDTVAAGRYLPSTSLVGLKGSNRHSTALGRVGTAEARSYPTPR